MEGSYHPLDPHQRPVPMDPVQRLRQRVKPPRLQEVMRVNGDGPGGLLCGYLRKNFGNPNHANANLYWRKRWFVLDPERGMLYYYRAGVSPEDMQRVHTRGWVDLRKPGTVLVTSPGDLEPDHKGHVAATQFHLRFRGEDGEAKVLKLSAPSEASYTAWVTALRDVVGRTAATSSATVTPIGQGSPFPGSSAMLSPQGTVIRYPTPGGATTRPRTPGGSVSQPPAPTIDRRIAVAAFSLALAFAAFGGPFLCLCAIIGGNAALWMHTQGAAGESGGPPVHRRSVDQDSNPRATPSAAAAPAAAPLLDPRLLFVGFNALLLIAVAGEEAGFLLALAAGNAGLWRLLPGSAPAKAFGVSARSGGRGRRMPSMAVSDDECEEDERDEGEGPGTPVVAMGGRPSTPAGARQHVPEQPKHRGGLTLRRCTGPDDSRGYSVPDPASFNVRIGPDYPRNHRKAPSQGQILTAVGGDLFTCDRKIEHIMRYLWFPEVDFEVAHWFVVHASICNYAPPNPLWHSGPLDGPGMSLVIYCPITPAVWEQIQTAAAGPLELLRRFLNADQLPRPEEVYDRVKLIATLVNVDDPKLQLSTTCSHLVKTWNSKPCMTRPQHRIIHADFYTELDIDLHEFSFLARKGITGFLPRLKEMVVNAAILLEAQTDSEMPEQVLACFTLNRVDLEKGKPW